VTRAAVIKAYGNVQFLQTKHITDAY